MACALLACVFLAPLLGGCNGCTASEPTPPKPVAAGAAASSTGDSAQEVSVSVVVTLDGKGGPVTVRSGKKVNLAGLLPAAGQDMQKWRGLHAAGSQKRQLNVRQFAEAYGKTHDVSLYIDEQDRACVGMFMRITDAMPQRVKNKLSKPTVVLVDVKKVDVRTLETAVEETTLQGVDVVLGGVTKHVKSSQITALKPAAAKHKKRPGQQRRGTRGWLLYDVLGLTVPAAKLHNAKTTIVVAGGRQGGVSLTAKELSTPGTRALLRHNRRGAVIFELWPANAIKPSKRVRAVSKITISP